MKKTHRKFWEIDLYLRLIVLQHSPRLPPQCGVHIPPAQPSTKPLLFWTVCKTEGWQTPKHFPYYSLCGFVLPVVRTSV